jgi:hypothetical protein
VASGFLTAIVDGQRQPKQFGEFFVVPAGHKLQIVTAGAVRSSLQSALTPTPPTSLPEGRVTASSAPRSASHRRHWRRAAPRPSCPAP